MPSICLCLAIGFSWLGFMSAFTAHAGTSARSLMTTCMASSICLGAIAFAFSVSPAYGGWVVMIGLFLAYSLGDVLTPLSSIGVSAAGFAIYLNGAGI